MNHLYEVLANLLEYPGEDWNDRVERCKQWLTIQEPDVAIQFIGFRRKVGKLSIAQLQELYTRTFDLNPVCTLDIGYHLFAENYKRGELLAHLRETEAPFGLGQADQLPDYLPVLLRLLVKLKDDELRLALIAEVMVPALDKMVQTFGEGDNPYRDLIETISKALRNELPEGTVTGRLAQGDTVPELYRISSNTAARH